MRVLLIGNGGREHALAWKIAESSRLTRLFIAPGNAGTDQCGKNVNLTVDDHADILAFCQTEQIDLVVVGPEAPLVAGLTDDLVGRGIKVFGPSRRAAQLEGSKAFTKALCDEMHIPTAAYGHFTAFPPALAYAREIGAPIVVKADGLAAGKGVTIAMTLAEAETALADCFSGSFGDAGAEVVIEEFLEGEEASIFALSDGTQALLLATAQDHKRAFDGDKGPNTGGMGAFSPAPIITADILAQIERDIILPTVAGMRARGTPFTGVLYAGIMLTKTGPKLIEYNARFGDPECQVLMMRLKSDVLDLLEACAAGDLSGVTPQWRAEAALSVVMATSGYPGPYGKGSEIRGANVSASKNLQIFHAGTLRDGNRFLANGGRVLSVTALGANIAAAQANAYAAVEAIDWPEGFYRHDIGWRAVAKKPDA